MPMNRSGSKIPKVQVVLTIFPSPVMPDTSGVSLARKKKKKKKGPVLHFGPATEAPRTKARSREFSKKELGIQ